jgi:dGTPase
LPGFFSWCARHDAAALVRDRLGPSRAPAPRLVDVERDLGRALRYSRRVHLRAVRVRGDGEINPVGAGGVGGHVIAGAARKPGEHRPTWAADAAASTGRPVAEPLCPMRTVWQRDRDRIVHATAFRRLTYKTQVFVYHEGDHYRTRLTHTLEVAQIARALARMLTLDEDLAEALALAHDLGHPPFGHAGERALDRALAHWGGFDHNAQSLAIVTRLERKYAAFDGLNLTFETLEGLVKHNGPLLVGEGGTDADRAAPHACLLGAVAEAGLADRLHLAAEAPLEAQAAAIADDIAYNNHDIDDGLRAGLLTLEELADVPLAGRFVTEVADAAGRDRSRLIYEVNRRMITAMVADAVTETRRRLGETRPASLADVRAAGRPLVAFSETMQREIAGLSAFLFERVYRHTRVVAVMAEAERVVADLVACYLADPGTLPPPRDEVARALDAAGRAALVADFVSGMTDRFAIAEHRRLFDATPDLR